MSTTHVYTAGARTRNVINIGNPGGTAPTIEVTANSSDPSAATDGFANFRSQKNLHILIHNNGLVSNNSSGANKITDICVWGYNSSLGGQWTKLSLPISQGNGSAIVFDEVELPDVAQNAKFRTIIPIEGIERIALTYVVGGTVSSGQVDIYLGVNTI